MHKRLETNEAPNSLRLARHTDAIVQRFQEILIHTLENGRRGCCSFEGRPGNVGNQEVKHCTRSIRENHPKPSLLYLTILFITTSLESSRFEKWHDCKRFLIGFPSKANTLLAAKEERWNAPGIRK